MPIKDMTGQRFTRLVVLRRVHSDKNGNARWSCQCDCGKVIETHGFNLRNGASKSCGCLTTDQLRERTTSHQMSKSPEYVCWASMIQRCTNPRASKYNLYGGRGITVCSEWIQSFERFFADMGPRPSPEYSIERTNGNEGYHPGNCRWATNKEQANNTTQNVMVTYQGKAMTLQQAIDASASPIRWRTVRTRINLDWPLNDALTIPPGGKLRPSMVGKKFNRWEVVNDDIKDRRKWLCMCSCGTIKEVDKGNVKSGASQSCGCLSAETAGNNFRAHGASGTPEFNTWCNIRSRCRDPNSADYPTHGGRGIKVCQRWSESFEAFLADVGAKPSPRHRLRRINLDGDFEPENCLWVPPKNER